MRWSCVPMKGFILRVNGKSLLLEKEVNCLDGIQTLERLAM